MVRKCYEFFGCTRKACPMFDEKETRNCWEVDNTLFHCLNGKEPLEGQAGKAAFCSNCLYHTYREKAAN